MDGIIIVVIIIIVVVVIIIVVVVIIIVVVVVGKGKAIKRKYKLLVTPASGSPEVDQGLVEEQLQLAAGVLRLGVCHHEGFRHCIAFLVNILDIYSNVVGSDPGCTVTF